jgi:hypothetical protein
MDAAFGIAAVILAKASKHKAVFWIKAEFPDRCFS